MIIEGGCFSGSLIVALNSGLIVCTRLEGSTRVLQPGLNHMLSIAGILVFRDIPSPADSIDRPKTSEDDREETVEGSGAFLCKACGHIITYEEDRVSLQGAHRHTFANPHGLVFEIGLFQTAPGCTYEGPLTAEFSWFAGFQWKIALCSRCLIHLGWLFVSSTNRVNGLILSRLVRNIR